MSRKTSMMPRGPPLTMRRGAQPSKGMEVGTVREARHDIATPLSPVQKPILRASTSEDPNRPRADTG